MVFGTTWELVITTFPNCEYFSATSVTHIHDLRPGMLGSHLHELNDFDLKHMKLDFGQGETRLLE